ncbi:MAG: hypothetical protein BMS9Abin31_0523 [Gammaproteobacteria bacterium]|nr:MAG: hypothetical protein BMS9Abin31_0523 [Gammaproteobacteria bacterium]
MNIQLSTLPKNILNKLNEDITIKDGQTAVAYIISPKAYAFFIKEVHRREDEEDHADYAFHKKNPEPLEDCITLKQLNNEIEE